MWSSLLIHIEIIDGLVVAGDGHDVRTRQIGGRKIGRENYSLKRNSFFIKMVEPLSNSLFDADKLNLFKKSELINMIMELQKEKDVLKNEVSNLSSIGKRVIELERSQALYLQYNSRHSVEITGIPEDVEQKDLECQVIKIYDEAEVDAHGRSLNHFDIEAFHRIRKKNVVIV